MDNSTQLDIQAQKEFEFTQNIRKNMIMDLTKNGPTPASREDASTLLTAMKDMDAQNIQRLRVKVEEKIGGTMAGMASTVSAILREVNPSAFTFGKQTKDVTDAMAKTLPSTVEKAVIVPGELSVDPPQGDYNSFITKMKS